MLFSALGPFIGYVIPSENVTQIVSLVLMLCCFAGGLLVPIRLDGEVAVGGLAETQERLHKVKAANDMDLIVALLHGGDALGHDELAYGVLPCLVATRRGKDAAAG